MNISKLLLASTMLCALSAPAFADTVTNGNTYFKLSGGAIIPEDIDGVVGGTNATLSFDTGWQVSGTLGKNLTDTLAIEGEIGYFSADFKDGTAGGGTLPIDGKVSGVLGFINANFHPLAKGSFDPYVGAGIGVSHAEIKIDSVGGAPVNISDDGTDLALQASAGFNFAVAAGTSIGAQYRYLWTDTGGSGIDAFTAHNITAHVTFAF